MKNRISGIMGFLLIVTVIVRGQTGSQAIKNNPGLDEKVKKFLADHSGQWYDMNTSASDGQMLYDLIIKGNYKSALEIGTSD